MASGNTENISQEDVTNVQLRFVEKRIPEGSNLIDISKAFEDERLGGATQLKQK